MCKQASGLGDSPHLWGDRRARRQACMDSAGLRRYVRQSNETTKMEKRRRGERYFMKS